MPHPSLLRSNTTRLFQLLSTALPMLLLAACANTSPVQIWRQIPIQMTRVSQTDSYSQRFLLDNSKTTTSENLTAKQRQHVDARMDDIFSKLIGSRNWQYMKNLYGVSSIRDELLEKRLHMEGLINLTTYLYPDEKLDTVILEGFGRFFAVRDKTNEILLSGDFHIKPQRYKLSDFKSGCIPLDTNIYTTRIPGKPTFYKDTIVRYDLFITSHNKNKKTFSINYENEHPAYIDLNGDNQYDKSERFALLKMNARYSQAKLIDLSGLKLVKNDYKISSEAELEAKKEADIDMQRSCIGSTQ